MVEATAAMGTTGTTAAARDARTTVTRAARRVWRAGLGAFAVTAEHVRGAFSALEHKGEEIEPTVTAPLKRAGERATRVAERAGVSVKSVGDAVSSATSSVADVGKRFRTADLTQDVERLVDQKLAAALNRLDLATKADLQALADRIDDMTTEGKRARGSQ